MGQRWNHLCEEIAQGKNKEQQNQLTEKRDPQRRLISKSDKRILKSHMHSINQSILIL